MPPVSFWLGLTIAVKAGTELDRHLYVPSESRRSSDKIPLRVHPSVDALKIA